MRRLFWNLSIPFTVLILSAIILSSLISASAYRRFYFDDLKTNLETRLRLIEPRISAQALNDFKTLGTLSKEISDNTSMRITIIGPHGKVIADSDSNPAGMDNHLNRGEVLSALKSGTGFETRYSETLREKMLYAAIAVYAEGDSQLSYILRASKGVNAINAAYSDTFKSILKIIFAITIISAAVCFYISRRIARPLETLKTGAQHYADGNFDFKLCSSSTEEIASLAVSMNNMAAEIKKRIAQITDQKDQQAAILSDMSEGVLAIDADYKILLANSSACRLLGLKGDVRGRLLHDTVRLPAMLEYVDSVFEQGAQSSRQIRIGTSESLRFINLSASAIDTADRIHKVVIVLNDITEMQKLQEMRKDFVANVSHELKTPITSIKGFVETLLDGAIDDAQKSRHFLGIIRSQTDRLDAIINDLLTLSRLERAFEERLIHLCEEDVSSVIKSSVEICQYKAQAKDIAISIDCPEFLNARLNRTLFEQALANLIDNAVKYSPNGSSVTVSAEKDNGKINIAVKDNGPGIAPEHLARLFERFYRVDKARSRDRGGTGLGLSIVKHIAAAHSGSVSVDSQPGSGSTFIISIPDKPLL
ncbi:Alkaline phosphatase synthesis sensor protein PhoR [Limihaloglobus sulfuriphilus]|uniref:histidine kinase n=1 Tax=Limihaloglobus sulfuriphilus TaxID=1851148 RepID=A0A1Q2MBR5_9BACT|nr:ATP-binding protein [Limihaloglobus sulfuriphilus]AQQ70163.1 Alkaline phosphatase synthesis sensor protein PhoR [Limihaloglobus sulfuriphilus]